MGYSGAYWCSPVFTFVLVECLFVKDRSSYQHDSQRQISPPKSPPAGAETVETVRMERRQKGSGSLQWDAKRGRWVGDIRSAGRRHRVVVTPTGTDQRSRAAARREAQRRLDALAGEVRDSPDLVGGNTTLAELLDLWASRYLPGSTLSARTVEGYTASVGVLTAELGGKRVRTLRPDDVEAVFQRLASTPSRGKHGGGMSRATLVKHRSVLSQALGWGERRGLVPKNIATLVELPGNARRDPVGQSLTLAEARQLLSVTDRDRLHALWRILITLGLRPGEALGLKWDCVDFDAGVIHVRRSLKTVKGRPVLSDTLKTSKSRRSLSAPTAVVDALKAHKVGQAEERLKAGPLWSTDWPGLVFTTRLGTPVEQSNLRREFERLVREAGVKALRPYDLRHTAASLMSEQGARLEDLADVLGHVDTRMAMRVYRHQLSATNDVAARFMGELG